MTIKPDEIKIVENNEGTETVQKDYLGDVIGDMPQVSPAAETIANKVLNEKQEQIPTPEGPKKRGPKPGSKNKATTQKSTLGGVADAGQRANASIEAERLAAATFITGAVEVSGVALGGKSAAMGELEKVGMVAVWDKYLKSKNINDIPPGMALALVMSQYYGRVLTTPEAKPKVEKFFTKITKRFRGWKNARFGSRNDGERENNAGEANDKGLSGGGDKMSGFRPSE